MPNAVFDVTPEKLDSSATVIENKAGEFKTAYTSIYTAVGDLNVTFKGEASKAFNERINQYKNDFSAADKALAKYVQFLRTYAKDLKIKEESLKAKASTLSSGK